MKYRKKINIDSKLVRKYTYKNFKLKKQLSLDKDKINKIYYTIYVSYWGQKKKRH